MPAVCFDFNVYKQANVNMVIRSWYNSFLVYCRELATGTVSLTGDQAQGDDSKHDSHYSAISVCNIFFLFLNQNRCCGYSKETSQ